MKQLADGLYLLGGSRNRESARRLAALQPALVCFGHGPPLRDPRALSKFASRLPA